MHLHYYGAGIGAGGSADGNRSKAISIYGGTVNASSAFGAGIGAGRAKIEGTGSLSNKLVAGHGGLVKFYGGNVTAQSQSASAIGGTNYTATYEDGSSKTFYGNPGILYMEPSIMLYYGNDENTATNTVTTTSLSQNVGANVDRQHYATYTTGASETHVYAPATCTEPRTCMVCGATDGEPLGHEFTEQGELISAADCTHGTLYAVKCVRCEETNGTLEIGSPLGHDYDALYVVKEATETEPAEYHAVCTRCGDITDSYIPQTPWKSATLTIIQEGVFLGRGATFKHNYGSTLPLSECDIYVNGSVVTTIKNGKEWTAPECLLCTKINRGISSSRIYFVSACDFTEATCTEPATCVYCGEADGEAPGHTWEGATCTEPAVCSACGAIGEALGHDFSKPGTLISAADCTNAAVYTAKCVRCEETNGTLQVGSPLGHKYELIKKLSDSPLTYTAECLVCGEYNEAYEVPDKYYSVTDKVTTASMQVGRTVKPNSVITLDATSKMLQRKITVYIDGIKVYEGENDYTTPNQCLKCVYKNGTTLKFETDCLFIRANCESPKTCVYCGHTVGSALGHTFEKGKCTRCSFVQDEFLFDSVSLVLSGELGLNFYTVVNDAEAVKDGYMLFEIGNKVETQAVYFTDAVLVGERYVFICKVNALQMADTITVSFHYGDTVVGPKTTSVASYIDKVIENHSNDDTHPTVKLAKSILNYGHYAQIALSELHGFTLGTDYTVTNNKNDVTIANSADLEQYKATKTGSISEITKVTRSLSLDHGTDINLYLTVAEAYEPTVNVTDKNGNTVDFTLKKQADGRYLLVIPQIAAHELGDMYTVSVDDGAMTVNVSALSYAYSVLNSEKTDAQKLCVSALYEYYNAAISYKESVYGGHSFGEWIDEIPSTCINNGVKAHKNCLICGKNFDADGNEITDLKLPLGEHDYQKCCTSSDSAFHTAAQVCSVCGNIGGESEKEIHTFANKDAEHIVCFDCGFEMLKPSEGINYEVEGNHAAVISTTDENTDDAIVVASIYDGKPVTKIEVGAFSCCTMSQIFLPDTIKEICNYSFAYCDNLTSVVLPEKLEVLGYGVFGESPSITDVTFPDSITSVGRMYFDGENHINIQFTEYDHCYYLGNENNPYLVLCYSDVNANNITIPDGTKVIADYAFAHYGENKMQTIVVPDTIVTVGDYAFATCDALDKVYYKGTESQWNDIVINNDMMNQDFTDSIRYYYSEKQPLEAGHFWVYVDGTAMEW